MLSGYETNRINNVAARVVVLDGGLLAYHPDCIPDNPPFTDDDITIDHPYLRDGGSLTSPEELCEGCGELLGESAGQDDD